MLVLDYMMHTGMAGPHQFRVHLQTNDPAAPETLLLVKSNWVP